MMKYSITYQKNNETVVKWFTSLLQAQMFAIGQSQQSNNVLYQCSQLSNDGSIKPLLSVQNGQVTKALF